MVYRGKPSRGCHSCRIRKVKCDEGLPGCSQCTRYGTECSGYQISPVPAASSKSTTVTMATTKKLAPIQQRPPDWLPNTNSASCLDQAIKAHRPKQCIDELAACYFISRFVRGRNRRIVRGFLEFIIPLASTERPGEHFNHIFHTCALAMFGANHPLGGGNMKSKTHQLYNKALAATAVALQNPRDACGDAMLASVLLLGLYEGLAGASSGLFAWNFHINGAIQLIRARGAKQLRTKMGFDLFIAVRTLMIIRSWITGEHPAAGVPWCTDAAVYDKYASSCENLSIRVSELNAQADTLLISSFPGQENSSLVLSLLQRCQDLESEFDSWFHSVPYHFKWKTVTWVKHVPNDDYTSAEICPGRVDIYSSAWVVNMWNMARSSRLMLSSTVVRCSSWLSFPVNYRATAEYARAMRISNGVIADTIASIPYQLGWLSKQPKELREEMFRDRKWSFQDNYAELGLSAYFLLWVLTVIQLQDYLTKGQRAWVKGRLRYISNDLGLKTAATMSQLTVRIPSMLITRDRLMTTNYSQAADTKGTCMHAAEEITAECHDINSSTGIGSKSQQTLQLEWVQRQAAKLVREAVEKDAKIDDWTIRSFLRLPVLPA
ncbi:transcriptional regulator family: Fungal Specific TF [Purpureocillium lilacinum]|uniref:Transcriptional regulator family: Fungal Specific TF n=1 Tax=Purpureocillium lilacinum TaxID=33203 RepID=A0ABR0BF11_PURLI|nr:transcriptional regulator family: Fungal Specific TF [Purpureocillium lilacinum]